MSIEVGKLVAKLELSTHDFEKGLAATLRGIEEMSKRFEKSVEASERMAQSQVDALGQVMRAIAQEQRQWEAAQRAKTEAARRANNEQRASDAQRARDEREAQKRRTANAKAFEDFQRNLEKQGAQQRKAVQKDYERADREAERIRAAALKKAQDEADKQDEQSRKKKERDEREALKQRQQSQKDFQKFLLGLEEEGNKRRKAVQKDYERADKEARSLALQAQRNQLTDAQGTLSIMKAKASSTETSFGLSGKSTSEIVAYTQKVKALQTELDQFKKANSSLISSNKFLASDIIRLESNLSRLTSTLHNAKASATGFGKSIKSGVRDVLDGTFGAILKFNQTIEFMRNGLSGIRWIVMDVGGSFVKVASDMEQYRMRLDVAMGSTKEGARAFDEMATFAAKLPFTIDEVMGSAANLAPILSGGTDELKKWMPLIADISAAFGLSMQETQGNFTKMYSAGAAAADLFRERGILPVLGFLPKISYSAMETRKSLSDMMESGTFAFKGLSERLAMTWNGQVGKLEDRWILFQKKLMDSGPFVAIKAIVLGLNNVLEQNADNIDELAKKLGFSAEGMIDTFVAGIPIVIGYIGKFIEQLGRILDNLDKLLEHPLAYALFGNKAWKNDGNNRIDSADYYGNPNQKTDTPESQEDYRLRLQAEAKKRLEGLQPYEIPNIDWNKLGADEIVATLTEFFKRVRQSAKQELESQPDFNFVRPLQMNADDAARIRDLQKQVKSQQRKSIKGGRGTYDNLAAEHEEGFYNALGIEDIPGLSMATTQEIVRVLDKVHADWVNAGKNLGKRPENGTDEEKAAWDEANSERTRQYNNALKELGQKYSLSESQALEIQQGAPLAEELQRLKHEKQLREDMFGMQDKFRQTKLEQDSVGKDKYTQAHMQNAAEVQKMYESLGESAPKVLKDMVARWGEMKDAAVEAKKDFDFRQTLKGIADDLDLVGKEGGNAFSEELRHKIRDHREEYGYTEAQLKQLEEQYRRVNNAKIIYESRKVIKDADREAMLFLKEESTKKAAGKFNEYNDRADQFDFSDAKQSSQYEQEMDAKYNRDLRAMYSDTSYTKAFDFMGMEERRKQYEAEYDAYIMIQKEKGEEAGRIAEQNKQRFMSAFSVMQEAAQFKSVLDSIQQPFEDFFTALISGSEASFGKLVQVFLKSIKLMAAQQTAKFLFESMSEGLWGMFYTIKAKAQAAGMDPSAALSEMSAAAHFTAAKVALGNAAVIGSFAAGMSLGGMAHSGIDAIPEEGTWLLQKGERVVDQRTNQDLKGFLNGKNKGDGVTVNVTINGGDEKGVMNSIPALKQAIISAVTSDIMSNGSIRKAIRTST